MRCTRLRCRRSADGSSFARSQANTARDFVVDAKRVCGLQLELARRIALLANHLDATSSVFPELSFLA
jgi:hypothetical protein